MNILRTICLSAVLPVMLALAFSAFAFADDQGMNPISEAPMPVAFTADTPIADVPRDPAFGSFGRLLFPVNQGYYSGSTLGSLSLTWYSNIRPEKTVEIVNGLRSRALSGEPVFFDLYTEEEKATDPAKVDTGLFFFRGEPGA